MTLWPAVPRNWTTEAAMRNPNRLIIFGTTSASIRSNQERVKRASSAYVDQHANPLVGCLHHLGRELEARLVHH